MYHKFWSEPPQPIYMDIYLFNWTNPHEFTNKSVKPNFVEIGPFRFQEHPQKVNVTWHDANSTVSYRKQSRYHFIPEQSNGRLDDVITSVNVIALVSSSFACIWSSQLRRCFSQSSAVQARSWNILKVKGVEFSLALYGQKLHITKTASEWLFEGYDDPIITVAKDIASILGVGDIPFDRFGWFYQVHGDLWAVPKTFTKINLNPAEKRLESSYRRFQCQHRCRRCRESRSTPQMELSIKHQLFPRTMQWTAGICWRILPAWHDEEPDGVCFLAGNVPQCLNGFRAGTRYSRS